MAVSLSEVVQEPDKSLEHQIAAAELLEAMEGRGTTVQLERERVALQPESAP